MKPTIKITEIQYKLRDAASLFQKGQLYRAEAVCHDILKLDPRHSESFHLLGLIAFQNKAYQRAADLIEEAIRIDPRNPHFYSNRGAALKELELLDEAVASYDQAIGLKPDFAEAYNNRGTVLKELRRLDEAVASYDRAIRIKSDFAEAYSNRGNALKELRKLKAAIESYDRAIDIKPNHAQAYNNRGLALKDLKRFDDAIASFDKAISIKSGFAEAHNNRGIALKELRHFEEAIASYDRAIDIKSDYAEAYSNRGVVLRELKQLDKALASCDRAISIKPDFAEAYNNRGLVLRELQYFDDAVASYDQAISHKPDYAEACFNKAVALLTNGAFTEGWKLYSKRPSSRDLADPIHRQPLNDDLTSIQILLLKEQGLGDEVFFLRFAPELKRRGAHLTYRAGGKIASMLRRLPVLDTVIDDDAPAPSCDMHLTVGDLPFLLTMKSVDDIPPSLRLVVMPERLAIQKAMLAAMGSPPYVGVTWRAGTDQRGSLFKSAPLDKIGAVLQRMCGTLIALQRDPQAGEIDALAMAAGKPVHDLTGLNDNLEDMLALLALLDDYVTVSNTNVHLRAAVNRGSRVLVPSPPEYRWMAAGSVSPWFPDCGVYRQGIDGSWDEALAALAADLAASHGAVHRGTSS